MSRPNELDVYRALMDLDLILQDYEKMVLLRLFLASVPTTNSASVKLHGEIRKFTILVERLVEAAQKACDNLNSHPQNKKSPK